MKRLLFVLVASLMLVGHVPARAKVPAVLVKDASYTAGHYVAQQTMVEKILDEHPNLKRPALNALLAFDRKFGAAFKHLDTQLEATEGLDWTNKKAQFRETLRRSISDKKISRDEAVQFIQDFASQANGEMPSPVIETILMFTPAYHKQPEKELLDGFKQVYVSDGSGKAKGVKFQVDLPRSWKISPGRTSHEVFRANSNNGRGTERIALSVQETPLDGRPPMTVQGVAAVLTTTLVEDTLPTDAVFIGKGPLKGGGWPGYWVRFSRPLDPGRTSSANLAYIIFYGDRQITISATAFWDDDETQLAGRFKFYEKLFTSVMATLVLPVE